LDSPWTTRFVAGSHAWTLFVIRSLSAEDVQALASFAIWSTFVTAATQSLRVASKVPCCDSFGAMEFRFRHPNTKSGKAIECLHVSTSPTRVIGWVSRWTDTGGTRDVNSGLEIFAARINSS
jgi:hypothetical protein